jgi:hypothetical protein
MSLLRNINAAILGVMYPALVEDSGIYWNR